MILAKEIDGHGAGVKVCTPTARVYLGTTCINVIGSHRCQTHKGFDEQVTLALLARNSIPHSRRNALVQALGCQHTNSRHPYLTLQSANHLPHAAISLLSLHHPPQRQGPPDVPRQLLCYIVISPVAKVTWRRRTAHDCIQSRAASVGPVSSWVE